MSDELTTIYNKQQLERILEEALIYMCACPAQVAEELLHLRKLFAYQQNCISKGALMADVHHRISDSARKAHAEMEQCLGDVLQMEGWNTQTFAMPAGLRQVRQQSMDQD